MEKENVSSLFGCRMIIAAAIYHRELFCFVVVLNVYRLSCSFPTLVHLTLENSAAGKQFQQLRLAQISTEFET